MLSGIMSLIQHIKKMFGSTKPVVSRENNPSPSVESSPEYPSITSGNRRIGVKS